MAPSDICGTTNNCPILSKLKTGIPTCVVDKSMWKDFGTNDNV